MSKTLSQISSSDELKELQRAFVDIICKPLLKGEKMVSDVRTAELVAGNGVMEPHERLELYAQQYWWRLIGSLSDDFPVTRAILGNKRFRALVEAYLVECPSQSFTLRHAGERLPQFIAQNSHLVEPWLELCCNAAQLEIAIIQVFNAPEQEPIGLADLQKDPTQLKFSLKPALVLLESSYQVHRLVEENRLSKRRGRADASNVLKKLYLEEGEHHGAQTFDELRKPTRLVVHRYDLSVYFKEQTKEQFALLRLLSDGFTLEQALQQVALSGDAEGLNLQETFRDWVSLGWLCARAEASGS